MSTQTQTLSSEPNIVLVVGSDTGLLAYHALQALRFRDDTDNVLARHGEAVDVLFPDPSDLEDQGADLEVLHQALVGGMSAFELGDAIASGVDVAVLTRALELGLAPDAVGELLSTYGGDLDGHLQNYVEAKEDARYRPDIASRALARYGEE